MNHHAISAILLVICFCILLFPAFFGIVAKASYHLEPDGAHELWNNLNEFQESKQLYDFLNEGSWIHRETTFEEFDYILCLCDQLTSNFNSEISIEILLATVAVESRFDVHDRFEGAHGLMQLLPIYHSARLAKFKDGDEPVDLDDFYDIRLNLATGLDYLNEIYEQTDHNMAYTLMWYNQGAVSASNDYISHGTVSLYANKIMDLAGEIHQHLQRGG